MYDQEISDEREMDCEVVGGACLGGDGMGNRLRLSAARSNCLCFQSDWHESQ